MGNGSDSNAFYTIKKSTLIFLISLFGIITTLLGFTYQTFFLDREEIEFVREMKKYQGNAVQDAAWKTNITRDIEDIRKHQEEIQRKLEAWQTGEIERREKENRAIVLQLIQELKKQGLL